MFALAAAALAFSDEDDDELPLASPFEVEPFAQAPEAGTEAPISFNPQLPGD
jgi:hypothetical protein